MARSTGLPSNPKPQSHRHNTSTRHTLEDDHEHNLLKEKEKVIAKRSSVRAPVNISFSIIGGMGVLAALFCFVVSRFFPHSSKLTQCSSPDPIHQAIIDKEFTMPGCASNPSCTSHSFIDRDILPTNVSPTKYD